MPYDVYNFLIRSVRDSDEDKVLQKFVTGFQRLYEAAWEDLDNTRKLYSAYSTLTSTQMDYLLNTLGMTAALAGKLKEYQKRRLIGQLISLWKVKSIKKGIAAHFNTIGSITTSYDEQWDFRWILEENALAEDNFALTQVDLCTTNIYLWVAYMQELSFIIKRNLGTDGLYRVKAVDLTPLAITVGAGAILMFDQLLVGPSAAAGIDFKFSTSGWLSDIAFGGSPTPAVDQFGYPIQKTVYSPGLSAGDWTRRIVDLTDFVGETIDAIGFYDFNTNNTPTNEIRLRRVVLQHDTNLKMSPLFCHKSAWTNVIDTNNATEVSHQISSGLSYYSSVPLIKEIANQMRPVGERFQIRFVGERHEAPFDDYKGFLTYYTAPEAVTGYLVFATDDDGTVEPLETDKYLGAKDYAISVKAETPGVVRAKINCSNAGANYYEFRAINGEARIYRYVDSVGTQLGIINYDARGLIHRFMFVRCGNAFKIYIDGTLAMSVTDAANAKHFSGSWKLFGNGFKLIELTVMPIPTHMEELGS